MGLRQTINRERHIALAWLIFVAGSALAFIPNPILAILAGFVGAILVFTATVAAWVVVLDWVSP